MKIAYYKGIDAFNRPVFKDNNNNYYCLCNKLYSYGEKINIEDIKNEEITFKGKSFNSEPNYIVNDIILKI